MLDSRAYTEVYNIINLLDEELKEKIPNNITKNIKDRMDRSYKCHINGVNIEEVELLKDTEKILSVIYTDYLATEEERKVILEAEEKVNNIIKNKMRKKDN